MVRVVGWPDNLRFIIIPSFESGESFSMTRGIKVRRFEDRMGIGLRDLSLVKSLSCVWTRSFMLHGGIGETWREI